MRVCVTRSAGWAAPQAFAAVDSVEVDGRQLMLLGKQSQRVEGELVSSYMLRTSVPDSFLTPSEVLASQVRHAGRLHGAAIIRAFYLGHH